MRGETDTPDRIREALRHGGPMSNGDVARAIGRDDTTVRRAVRDMPDVTRELDGTKVMLVLQPGDTRALTAVDLEPSVEEGAKPQPPASSRVALIEQLLDVERVIEEMTARRNELLEALR